MNKNININLLFILIWRDRLDIANFKYFDIDISPPKSSAEKSEHLRLFAMENVWR
jgi:hypothetical protein